MDSQRLKEIKLSNDWASLVGKMGDIHVIPVADIHAHSYSGECWCSPNFDMEHGIYEHNSGDRRELYDNGDLKKN